VRVIRVARPVRVIKRELLDILEWLCVRILCLPLLQVVKKKEVRGRKKEERKDKKKEQEEEEGTGR